MKHSIFETYSPRTLLVAWRMLIVLCAFAAAWSSPSNEADRASGSRPDTFACHRAGPDSEGISCSALVERALDQVAMASVKRHTRMFDSRQVPIVAESRTIEY